MLPIAAGMASSALDFNLYQYERLLDIIKAFQEFDVVCLQEVFAGLFSEIREIFIQYATKAGFLYIVTDDDPPSGGTYLFDGGLVILSRFPIVSTSTFTYSYGYEADGLCNRGVLYAKIEV